MNRNDWFLAAMLAVLAMSVGILIGSEAQLNEVFHSCKNHGAYIDGERAIMCVVSDKGKQ